MKNKINLVVCTLFGLMMINSGLNKFFEYIPMSKDMPQSMLDVMKAFSTMPWLIPLAGVVEIVGGILCIIPKYRALGAILLLPIVVGILFINIYSAPSGLPLAVTLLAVNAYIITTEYHKYLPMVR